MPTLADMGDKNDKTPSKRNKLFEIKDIKVFNTWDHDANVSMN